MDGLSVFAAHHIARELYVSFIQFAQLFFGEYFTQRFVHFKAFLFDRYIGLEYLVQGFHALGFLSCFAGIAAQFFYLVVNGFVYLFKFGFLAFFYFYRAF